MKDKPFTPQAVPAVHFHSRLADDFATPSQTNLIHKLFQDAGITDSEEKYALTEKLWNQPFGNDFTKLSKAAASNLIQILIAYKTEQALEHKFLIQNADAIIEQAIARPSLTVDELLEAAHSEDPDDE